MLLPKKIKGKNRVRDGAIVLFFKRDAFSTKELSEKFNLTERRILQILAKNHAFVKRDKAWEKEKRIQRLQQWLKKKGKETARDPMDILAELRKEIEGDKPTVDNSTNITSITVTNVELEDRIKLIKDSSESRIKQYES